MKQFGLPLIGAAVALALSACGGGSGGGKTVSLSGKLSGYTIVSNSPWHKLWNLLAPTPAYAALDQVDTLVAIPHHSGNIDEGVFGGIKTATINDDGSFSINITTDYDWVLLLVNSAATAAADKVVAYVTIPGTTDTGTTDSDTTLVDFPATQMSGNSISLGTVSAGAQLQYAVADQNTEDVAQHMNFTLEDLNQMAKYDDAYQHLANAYLNYNASTGVFYFPVPSPTWTGPLAYTLNDTFSNSDDLFYEGNQYTLTTNDTSLSLNDICNGDVEFGLYAPESITVNMSGTIYDAAQGMLNNSVTRNGDYCYNDTMNIEQNPNGFQMGFPTGEGGFKTSVSGLWELRQDGNVLASFDFDKAKPVYSPLNIPVDFIPLVKVNIDPDDAFHILSIEIKWQRYNPDTSSYEDVVDDASTDKLVYDSFVNLVDYSLYNPSPSEAPSFIQYDNKGLLSGTVNISGDYQWYNPSTIFTADPSSGTAKVTSLSVAYTMAGINYRFVWGSFD